MHITVVIEDMIKTHTEENLAIKDLGRPLANTLKLHKGILKIKSDNINNLFKQYIIILFVPTNSYEQSPTNLNVKVTLLDFIYLFNDMK